MAEKQHAGIRKRDNALAVIREYPNTFVLRGRSFRHWATPKEFATGVKRPVVILPGVYETWHYLRPVCEALNTAGHPVEVLPELGLNQRPIPSGAHGTNPSSPCRRAGG